MKLDLSALTIKDARELLVSRAVSVRELVSAYLDHAKSRNGDVHAFLEFFDADPAGAADLSRRIDEAQAMIDAGDSHILCGIPYATKDNILVEGRIASASSRMLENYRASYNAHVIDRLNAAGAIPIGRTNMDEFAMGSSTENSAFGMTRNPLDITRVPGGSSGGSAAAVAMNGALFALGTDTGGSIRQPAAFCGLVGMYPTYGSVSRSGAIAMGSSLDQIGPFARTASDARAVYDAIRGVDPLDATTLSDAALGKLASRFAVSGDAGPKVVGVPYRLLEMPGIDESVRANFAESVERLKRAGYEIREVDLPHAHLGLAAYYIIMPAEVSSNLSRLDGMRYGLRVPGTDLLDTYMKSRAQGFGAETRRRIILGTYVLSAGYYDAYYDRALRIRELIKRDFERAFASGVHAVVTPTTPTTAFRPGEKSDPLSMYMADIFTVTANLCHMPALSVPSGKDADGMPFGLQLVAAEGNDAVLFSIGEDFEGAATA